MQFYAISILLHRPFFSRSLKQPEHRGQKYLNHPRSICITAAQSILKLLRVASSTPFVVPTVRSSTLSSPHHSFVYTMRTVAKGPLPQTAWKTYSSAIRLLERLGKYTRTQQGLLRLSSTSKGSGLVRRTGCRGLKGDIPTLRTVT